MSQPTISKRLRIKIYWKCQPALNCLLRTTKSPDINPQDQENPTSLTMLHLTNICFPPVRTLMQQLPPSQDNLLIEASLVNLLTYFENDLPFKNSHFIPKI
jgi:hypothetical protein